MVKESAAINSLEALQSLEAGKQLDKPNLAAGIEKIPVMVCWAGVLEAWLEKILFRFGPHLFFHEVFYYGLYRNKKMKDWSAKNYLSSEEETLKKYERYMKISEKFSWEAKLLLLYLPNFLKL